MVPAIQRRFDEAESSAKATVEVIESKGFANPMVTATAIDRIVHHSVILEFDLPSYRTNEAQERQLQERQLQTTVTPNPERPK